MLQRLLLYHDYEKGKKQGNEKSEKKTFILIWHGGGIINLLHN